MATLSRLLCLLLIIGSTTTQIQTIAVGSVRLSLGMPKNTVISQLSPEFTVRDLESEGGPPGLTVLAKAGPPFHYVAHISFKSDRLVEVIRDWSPDDQQKGVETGDLLPEFEAASEYDFGRSGPLPFSITDEARDFGQCKSFLPLLTRFSRTPEARSRASGVRAPAMY